MLDQRRTMLEGILCSTNLTADIVPRAQRKILEALTHPYLRGVLDEVWLRVRNLATTATPDGGGSIAIKLQDLITSSKPTPNNTTQYTIGHFLGLGDRGGHTLCSSVASEGSSQSHNDGLVLPSGPCPDWAPG
ncbi:unnamed protein product [Vitrella brassicaformis CCMP3155]|uniref:Uncharacterized protein n=1 Tax=Vitrella brassicaformis (strain CCMP3155) TaxID=1169540 RepID=A0A0G4EG76_VITBC|nr:unnamed protein product [Vitrella brassicaformis CCMP3155]|eukprot:CEL94717.1 unnamed protein product [Vitrella brassicaformis CCMP3155]